MGSDVIIHAKNLIYKYMAKKAFQKAELRDALLTARAFQHDTDFLFSIVLAPSCPADLSNRFISPAIVLFSFLSSSLLTGLTMNKKYLLYNQGQMSI